MLAVKSGHISPIDGKRNDAPLPQSKCLFDERETVRNSGSYTHPRNTDSARERNGQVSEINRRTSEACADEQLIAVPPFSAKQSSCAIET